MGMERTIKRAFLTACSLAHGFVVALWIWPGRYGQRSVCSRCGLERWESEIHFGQLKTSLGRAFQDETNAVSAMLMNHPIISGHQHDWIGASGSGGGGIWFSKGVGPGRHLWQAVRSTNVANFLAELASARDTNSLLVWRDRLLNPRQSQDAWFAILTAENERSGGRTLVEAAEEEFRNSQLPGH